MAKIAILNDTPEVVVLITNFLTKGNHEFLQRIGTTKFVLQNLLDFRPDLIVVPIYRRSARFGQEIKDYAADVIGISVLEMLASESKLRDVPILAIAFSVAYEELPDSLQRRIPHEHYLIFPEGLQSLNPTISGLVGPALGGIDDVEKVRHSG